MANTPDAIAAIENWLARPFAGEDNDMIYPLRRRPTIRESIQSLLIPCFPRIAGLVPALRPGFTQMPIG